MTTSNTDLTPAASSVSSLECSSPYKTWICILCGWVYDEEQGDPDSGISAGTYWEDIPEDWFCPDCGVGKAEFTMIEI